MQRTFSRALADVRGYAGAQAPIPQSLSAAQQKARCLCGHAAARGTRELRLQPWQGGRVVRHVLTCGSPSAKRRCAYETYLD